MRSLSLSPKNFEKDQIRPAFSESSLEQSTLTTSADFKTFKSFKLLYVRSTIEPQSFLIGRLLKSLQIFGHLHRDKGRKDNDGALPSDREHNITARAMSPNTV